MNKAIAQSVFLLVIAALLAAASYAVRPGLLPWNPSEFELSLREALALEDALWVDARTEKYYAAAHYEGAILLNEESWEDGFAGLLDRWTPGSPIVVYCSSQSCPRSHQVAERLRAELGIEEAYAVRGGWEAMLRFGVAQEGSGR